MPVTGALASPCNFLHALQYINIFVANVFLYIFNGWKTDPKWSQSPTGPEKTVFWHLFQHVGNRHESKIFPKMAEYFSESISGLSLALRASVPEMYFLCFMRETKMSWKYFLKICKNIPSSELLSVCLYDPRLLSYRGRLLFGKPKWFEHIFKIFLDLLPLCAYHT